MGICQSRQPVMGTDEHGRKASTELNQDQNRLIPECYPSEVSHITRTLSLESTDADSARPLAPLVKNESATSFGSHECILEKPKYRRRKSGLVIDYLRSEGASSNRVMAHIETPRGVPIEEIYDGVHDGHILGEGITGKVRLITHRETGIQRAVKCLDLELVTSDEGLDRLLDEIKIMCALDHPNIVCLEEVYEGDSELYLTQELCNGGDLFDRFDEHSCHVHTEAECAKIVKQIICSVRYLHSKNIIHRDLKLENFLFSDTENDSELKLIDFGLSKHFKLGEVQHEVVGTPYSVAPEVIIGDGYDEKCDIWAIGVITYLLLSGQTPFGGDYEGEDLLKVRDNILSGYVPFDPNIWKNVSDSAVDFIKSLLVLDPEKRPSAEDAQCHPWIMSSNCQCSGCNQGPYLDPKVIKGLKSFKELSSTRKFLCEILSFTLQPEQILGLREEFEKLDIAGKGEISLAGFKKALLARSEQHPLTEEEIEEMFNGLKVRNTDISIRWHEFIAACLPQCHIDDRNIRLAFNHLDADHKGYITLEDLKNAMDFYGSDSKIDLQSVWINCIIDYKCDKEYMTYDDFYKLLKLDRNIANVKPKLAAKMSKSQSIDSYRSSFATGTGLDDRRADEFSIQHFMQKYRRHSLGSVYNLDSRKIMANKKESNWISYMKAYRTMRSFILELTRKRNPRGNNKKPVLSGVKGLLLRRDNCSPVA